MVVENGLSILKCDITMECKPLSLLQHSFSVFKSDIHK